MSFDVFIPSVNRRVHPGNRNICQVTHPILAFRRSMTGDPDVCTNRVENAVYVAVGNDPYELLEVRLDKVYGDN
jgi:hypothetical protein